MPDEVAIAKEKVELLDSSAIIHEQAFCCSSSFYTPTTSMIVNWRLLLQKSNLWCNKFVLVTKT